MMQIEVTLTHAPTLTGTSHISRWNEMMMMLTMIKVQVGRSIESGGVESKQSLCMHTIGIGIFDHHHGGDGDGDSFIFGIKEVKC